MKIKRRCKCGCGGVTNYGRKWINGHNTKNYKHGLRNHKLYEVWANMKARCYNPNFKQYSDYGGRGIRVYIRWKGSFKSFYNWAVANGYEYGLEIDRKDNDRNYHPDNCRFVSHKKNCSNRRDRRIPTKHKKYIKRKDNTSGFTGVSFNKARNKYIASPWVHGKQVYLGTYDTTKEAAEAIEEYKSKL